MKARGKLKAKVQIGHPRQPAYFELSLSLSEWGCAEPEERQRERSSRSSAQTRTMELYLDLHSQPCRAVYLLAKKTGIPFQYKAVDLSAGWLF